MGSLMLSLPLRLYLQTSNSIEITGRASAVHTFLQKAPGVGVGIHYVVGNIHSDAVSPNPGPVLPKNLDMTHLSCSS